MNAKHKQRLMMVSAGMLGLALTAVLLFQAFSENMIYFYSPSLIKETRVPLDRNLRLGGLVATGSVQREPDGLTVHFEVTDNAVSVPVTFKGILPDLFREGQGIVTLGRLGTDGVFVAEEVLAKHDENYMPPEVAEMLKTAGSNQAPTSEQPL